MTNEVNVETAPQSVNEHKPLDHSVFGTLREASECLHETGHDYKLTLEIYDTEEPRQYVASSKPIFNATAFSVDELAGGELRLAHAVTTAIPDGKSHVEGMAIIQQTVLTVANRKEATPGTDLFKVFLNSIELFGNK